MLAVAFPDREMQVLPYNRLVKDFGGTDPRDFPRGRDNEWPPSGRAGRFRQVAGHVSMFVGGEWHDVELPPAPAGASAAASLDVSRLHDVVLGPLLGIGDPRIDPRIEFSGGARGTAALEERVRSGAAVAAFSMHPVRVDDLMTVSDAGDIMPPKSTWFEPKLRDGLLSHSDLGAAMSSASTTRIFNFSSGPAVLPLPVLEQAQRELVSLPGVGMSVMEISHRSKAFETLLESAVADIRALAGIPETYSILLLQGGASLQFSMVPMNLLGAGATADYIDTGSWAEKAAKEAARVGTVNVTGSTKADNYNRLPRPGEIALTLDAAYVHITTNNTIEGTEWLTLPDVGTAPLVADASSDVFSRPIDITRFGVVYAGAQKNLGPSGVTLVIIRQGPAGALVEDAAHDAQLPGDGREQFAVQHAQHLRRLHPGSHHAVAEVGRRPGRPSGS